jgi:hypothetical protein
MLALVKFGTTTLSPFDVGVGVRLEEGVVGKLRFPVVVGKT